MNQIVQRLTAFETRLFALESQRKDGLVEEYSPPGQDIQPSMLEDLLFGRHPDTGFNIGMIPGFAGLDLGTAGFPITSQSFHMQNGIGAQIRPLSVSERQVPADTTGDIISWGSEVEMPQPGESVPPPRVPPSIHVQAPTDSNGKSHRAGSASGPSYEEQGSSRQRNHVTPKGHAKQDPVAAFVNSQERDLPPPPSVLSPSVSPSTTPKLSRRSLAPQPISPPSRSKDQQGQIADHTSALLEPLGRPLSRHREMGHTADQSSTKIVAPAPWDLVTQRLYSWALVWEDRWFMTALEDMALDKEVRRHVITNNR